MPKSSRSLFLKHGQHGLGWLDPIFGELKHVIDEYIDWHDGPSSKDVGEPPYWNNETASVSMLIAAAARKRYITHSLIIALIEEERTTSEAMADAISTSPKAIAG